MGVDAMNPQLDLPLGIRQLARPPEQGAGAIAAKALARAADPETSKQAAERAVDFKPRDIAKIYAVLTDNGPMTAYEIAASAGLDHVAVSRRMREMVERNLVRDPETYEYLTRPSPRGRACIVWEARR